MDLIFSLLPHEDEDFSLVSHLRPATRLPLPSRAPPPGRCCCMQDQFWSRPSLLCATVPANRAIELPSSKPRIAAVVCKLRFQWPLFVPATITTLLGKLTPFSSMPSRLSLLSSISWIRFQGWWTDSVDTDYRPNQPTFSVYRDVGSSAPVAGFW